MGFYDCMGAIVTALGRRITMDEFDALYTRLEDEKFRLFNAGYPSDWLTAAQTVAKQIEIEKAVAQRQVIRNKLVYEDGKAFIAAARGRVDAGRALEARLVSINTPIPGGRRSVAGEAHALFQNAFGALLADLRRAAGNTDRLVALFSEPLFELEIAKALRGEPAHADAKLIAQAIEKTREDLRRQENDAGGFRGKLDGYVTRQSHDSLRVRRAAYQEWRDFILPLLDQERTFNRQEELKAQMRLEASQVREQLEAGQRDLQEARDELRQADRLDEKATARGRKLSDAERLSASQIEEARRGMAEALGRYMELAQKAREGARQAAPLLGEAGTAEVTGRQLMEARVALTRARERLTDLHDRASAGRGRTIENDMVRQHLAERVEEAAAIADRIGRGVDLMYQLGDRLHEYEARLRGAVDPEVFLQRVYNAIAADTWMRGDAQEFTGLMKYVGPGNLARRRAAHRELHFKSAEAEVSYMHQFGSGGLSDSIAREMEGAASAIATLRGLGPNPEAMFKRWQTDLLNEARETGNHALARQVKRRSLDWELAEVLGATRQVANPTVAAWASSVRVLQGMAKLGGAMLSSFGDIASAAAELRHQGRGALQSYGDMFDGLLKGRRSGEKRVIADLLGVGFEGLSGHVLSRLGGESAPPGAIAKASALFFRLNGLTWWTDAHKTTAGLVIGRYFAQMRKATFDALPKPTQRLLAQYAITPDHWNLLRQAAVHAAEDGTTFLTPEGARGIELDRFLTAQDRAAMAAAAELRARAAERPLTDEEKKQLASAVAAIPTERQLGERRDRLASAYATLVVDRVEHAVVTPGARERALVNMGTQRGDLLGEALRFIMQFKSFGLAMVTRSIGRDVYGGAGGKLSATARVAFLAFQLGIWGYLAMSAKELLAGKNPRDPLAASTWAAALAQGGGMGILGDYAFGEFNRFGQSALATAAGPTFGTANDLMGLWAKVRDTDSMGRPNYGADIAANSLRILASNTPYASLWWMRPALNYLALYPVQEALNPGYLRRMERRIQQQNKQTYWLSPQEAPRL